MLSPDQTYSLQCLLCTRTRNSRTSAHEEDRTRVRSKLYSPEVVEGRFSEGRPQEACLLSGGRHRRGAAQRKLLLGGQDDRRVRALHPPKLRRRPLADGLLYGRRLDYQSAGVYELGQPPLLLQGGIQVDRLHPVEGGPNAHPLAALLLDEPPELFAAASA